MKMVTSRILAVLIFMQVAKDAKSQCSLFSFTHHPPIPLNCKPFSNSPTPTWQLRTQCVVQRNGTTNAVFKIHWIHRDVNGVDKDLGQPTFHYHFPSVNPLASIGGPRVAGTAFTESMVGQYWCQVFFSDGTPLPVHGEPFTVLRPEEYDSQIPVCPTTGVVITEASICNDNPPPFPSAANTSTSTAKNQSVSPTPLPSSSTSITTTSTSDCIDSTTTITQPTPSALSLDQSTTTLPLMMKKPASSSPVLHTTDAYTPSHVLSTSSQVPPLSTSAATRLSSSSLSKDKTSTTYTQIQPSSTDNSLLPTINVTAPDDETPAGINVLLSSYHSLYVVAIIVIVAVSGLLVLTVCMRKRIKKAFVKKSVNVDMFETRQNTTPHNTNTTATLTATPTATLTATPTATLTAIPIRAHSQETLRSQCRTLRPLLPLPIPPVSVISTITDDSSEYYDAIYDNISDSTPEYIMVVGDTQYESLQGDTMDYTPGYCRANTDTQYEGIRGDTMNPVRSPQVQ